MLKLVAGASLVGAVAAQNVAQPSLRGAEKIEVRSLMAIKDNFDCDTAKGCAMIVKIPAFFTFQKKNGAEWKDDNDRSQYNMGADNQDMNNWLSVAGVRTEMGELIKGIMKDIDSSASSLTVNTDGDSTCAQPDQLMGAGCLNGKTKTDAAVYMPYFGNMNGRYYGTTDTLSLGRTTTYNPYWYHYYQRNKGTYEGGKIVGGEKDKKLIFQVEEVLVFLRDTDMFKKMIANKGKAFREAAVNHLSSAVADRFVRKFEEALNADSDYKSKANAPDGVTLARTNNRKPAMAMMNEARSDEIAACMSIKEVHYHESFDGVWLQEEFENEDCYVKNCAHHVIRDTTPAHCGVRHLHTTLGRHGVIDENKYNADYENPCVCSEDAVPQAAPPASTTMAPIKIKVNNEAAAGFFLMVWIMLCFWPLVICCTIGCCVTALIIICCCTGKKPPPAQNQVVMVQPGMMQPGMMQPGMQPGMMPQQAGMPPQMASPAVGGGEGKRYSKKESKQEGEAPASPTAAA